MYPGAVGLSLTVALILGAAIAAGLTVPALRVAFWVGLALACAASIAASVTLVLAVVAALALWNAVSGRGRLTAPGRRCRWDSPARSSASSSAP